MIRKFYTSIKGGQLVDNSGVFTRWLSARKDGECLITVATGVDAADPKRSSRQNAYYWGVVIEQYLHAMLDTGDNTIEDVARALHTETLADALHEMLKYQFAGREVLNYDTGEIMRLPGATSKMNTVEIGVYWDKIRADAHDKYGVEIPPPPDGVFDETGTR